ncbi:hypothetical protein BX661DRAFT_179681, partial [Kickxella alabastrina]|uniref:uncharacterized protein n=1 Tax=Kickxella alabastrina TaxID=61397 RepID=UPI00221F08CA
MPSVFKTIMGNKPQLIATLLAFLANAFIVVTTAFYFILDGRSTNQKPSTYYVTYIARVINMIAVISNFISIVMHKRSPAKDIMLYTALKHGGIVVLAACILIFDPMTNIALENMNGIGEPARSLFIAATIFAALFFGVNLVFVFVKPKVSKM